MKVSVRAMSRHVLLVPLLSVTLAHAAGYTVQDLGPAGAIRDLNNKGEVLIGTNAGSVIWRNGTTQALPEVVQGWNLNSQGYVLGDTMQSSGDIRYPRRSIVLRAPDGTVTTVTGINTLADPGSAAVALTEDGHVVVQSQEPLLWSLQNPVPITLHPLASGPDRFMNVWAYNASGTVVASATQDANNDLGYKTVFFVGTTNANAPDPGLVTVSAYLSFQAGVINDVGQVVGGKEVLNSKQVVTGYKSYIWSKATGEKAIPSLFLSSTTYIGDINNKGQAVGSAVPWSLSTSTPPSTVGIVWSSKTGTQNLNSLIGTASSKYKVTNARAINEAGQIAAEGVVNGESRLLLLTPKP